MDLSTRLKRLFFIYAGCVFMVFTALTTICLFIIEDGFFNHTLQAQARSLPQAEQLPELTVKLAPHITYYPDQQESPFAEYSFEQNDKYELAIGNQYYHLLTLSKVNGMQPVLAYNVTSQMLVNRSADDLAILFVPVLVVLLVVTYLLARFLVKMALSPFNQLVAVVSSGENHTTLLKLAARTEERDIKALLLKLADNWQQKEQLLQEKIRFNQGISHELRTPLQVAKHATELVLKDEPIAQRAHARLVTSLSKMEKISQAFLWLSSDNAWTTPVQIAPIVRNLLSQHQPAAGKRHIEFELEIAGNCVITAPDEVLEVLIENLIVNALNHSPAGKISIHCDQAKVQICNPIADKSQHDGFGVGMLLVSNMAERFNIRWQQDINNRQYVVTLYADVPSGAEN